MRFQDNDPRWADGVTAEVAFTPEELAYLEWHLTERTRRYAVLCVALSANIETYRAANDAYGAFSLAYPIPFRVWCASWARTQTDKQLIEWSDNIANRVWWCGEFVTDWLFGYLRARIAERKEV